MKQSYVSNDIYYLTHRLVERLNVEGRAERLTYRRIP